MHLRRKAKAALRRQLARLSPWQPVSCYWGGILPNPRFAVRIGIFKTKPIKGLEFLQRLRLVPSDNGNVAIPADGQKTFDAEGQALEHALTEILWRLEMKRSRASCSSVRRFRDATIKEECKSDYPHAQALRRALDRAEDFIQN